MRIVICGDTHIGAVLGLGGPNGSGGNTRVDDYEKTLNSIVDYAIETEADAFVQTGDVFDFRNPEPEHISVVNRCIRKLSNSGITSIWIMGNHDYKRSGNSWRSAITSLAAKDYPNTRIILNPEIVEITSNNEKSSLLLMPFRDRRMYEGSSCEEDSLIYESEVKDLIDRCDPGHPIVAIGHNFFYEGTYNHYGGSEVLINKDAFKKCDLIAMGHYHQFKILSKSNPIAVYTGSMEKLNFGDSGVDKFFIDYNTRNKKMLVKKTDTRRLVDKYISAEDASYTNLAKRIEEEVMKIDVDDSIVRIKIAIKDTLASSVKKQDIQKLLYNNNAFFVSKIILDPIHKRINKSLDILSKKSDISMFKAFLEKQDFPEDLKLDILKEAEILIK
jgi:exonuclease SbcD